VQLNSTYLLTYLHAGANNTVYLGDYLTRPASRPAGEAAVAVSAGNLPTVDRLSGPALQHLIDAV